MSKLDPIIAVKDVKASSKWYQAVFDCRSMHGGDHFDILTLSDGEVFLCLHKWETDGHPTMIDRSIPVGNGLILYFRTENMETIWQNAIDLSWPVEEEIHLNTNSLRREFSLKDPDGYYLTVTEFHRFEG